MFSESMLGNEALAVLYDVKNAEFNENSEM